MGLLMVYFLNLPFLLCHLQNHFHRRQNRQQPHFYRGYLQTLRFHHRRRQ
jgi:hypothetical protein